MRHNVVKQQMLSTVNRLSYYILPKAHLPRPSQAERSGCVYSKSMQIRSKTFARRLTRSFSVRQWWCRCQPDLLY